MTAPVVSMPSSIVSAVVMVPMGEEPRRNYRIGKCWKEVRGSASRQKSILGTARYSLNGSSLQDESTPQDTGRAHFPLIHEFISAPARSLSQSDLHSSALILSQPINLKAASSSSLAISIVLFPKLTSTMILVELGKTFKDS